MKIVTKLKIFGIFTAILVITLGITTYWGSYQIGLATEKNSIAWEIVKEAFNLNVLSGDYIQTHKKSTELQWQTQYRQFASSIDSYEVESLDEQLLVDKLKSEQKATLIHFSQLQMNVEEQASISSPAGQPLTNTVVNQELQRGLTNQLSTDTQRIVSFASNLADINGKRLAAIREGTSLFLLSIILILGVSFIVTYFLLARSISTAIRKLNEQTKIIASGFWAEKIDIKSNDEFGELANSFNEMTSKLKEYYEDLLKKTGQLESDHVKDEAILDSMGDGLIVTDGEGKITVMNQAAQKMLQLKLDSVTGKMLADVVAMEDEKGQRIPPIAHPVSLALKTGKKTSAIFYYKREDRTKFPAAVIVSPFVIAGGITGSIEVFHDITREKEIDKLKDEFLSIASHELRTPMTAIKGFVSMILSGDYGPYSKRLERPLYLVGVSTERLIHLVNDLLEVSRLGANKLIFNLQDVEVGTLVGESAAALDSLAVQKGMVLKVLKSIPSMVQADSDKAKQILNNLIGNALKFTDKGNITIETKLKDDLLLIAIQDTGSGIALEDQKKLFGKFEQIYTAEHGKPRGSGLGLYISREIARKMGGDLWLEKSERGKGSTFVFSLPKAQSKLAQKVKESFKKKEA